MELKFKASVRRSTDRVTLLTIPKWLLENGYVRVGKKYEFVVRELPDAARGIASPSPAFGSQIGSLSEVSV